MIRFFTQFAAALLLPLATGLMLADSADTARSVSAQFSHGNTNGHFEFYPEELDGPLTGGFGELTCHSCHFDYEINDERGSLTVEGPTENYRPAKAHRFQVAVESERLGIGGFQMTARFEDGSQAGTFEFEGDRLMFTSATDPDIQYLQHSSDGTSPTGERKVVWEFVWNAPEKNDRPVIFNIAANAGNYDYSEFGDWIYVKEFHSKPVSAEP